MNHEVIEKTSEQGFTLKVNLLKNSYLVFKSNKPLTNNRQESRSIIHRLSYVVFVGSEFDLSLPEHKLGELGFYPAREGILRLPFLLKGESDVRHICLPLFLNADLLPSVVQYYYRVSIIGNLTQAKDANLYFVFDGNHEQAELVKLKIRFPNSRLIFFNGEKETMVENQSDDLHQGNLAKMRVTDIDGYKDVGALSQNPVFAARFYLRQLDWGKMHNLPKNFALNKNDVETIMVFFNSMRKNLHEDVASMEALEKTEKYYRSIQPFFSLHEKEVDVFFEKYRDGKQLEDMRQIVHAQQKLHREQMDRTKSNFYLYACKKIEEALPAQYS